jgi:hypothetical protein
MTQYQHIRYRTTRPPAADYADFMYLVTVHISSLVQSKRPHSLRDPTSSPSCLPRVRVEFPPSAGSRRGGVPLLSMGKLEGVDGCGYATVNPFLRARDAVHPLIRQETAPGVSESQLHCHIAPSHITTSM